MDWAAIAAIGITVVSAVGASSWHLANKIASMAAAFTDEIHNLQTGPIRDLERRVDRVEIKTGTDG